MPANVPVQRRVCRDVPAEAATGKAKKQAGGLIVVMLSGKPDTTTTDLKTSNVQTPPIDPKSVGGSNDTR
jgi:hypothetical protein